MADWWDTRTWRLIQTNLREIDMRDIRADRVVADLRSFDASVLMINAAGIIASYPTDLPYHFQSPYLTGDSLAQIIDSCHAAGIRVIARTDFSKVRRCIYEQHPDWAYVSASGQIVDYNGDVHVCINGAYQQEYALHIIEECLTRLPFDGIFFNMGGYQTRDYSGIDYGPCHCENCRRRFGQMFGLDVPNKEDLDDPAYQPYAQFKRRTVREHQEKLYQFISRVRPEICIANHLPSGRGFIRQESNTALDRPLPHWQYSASANTKWATASYPAMLSSNTSVDFVDFPYRHAAVSPYQQALRLAQSLANGGAVDWYLIGRLDNHADRSGFEPIREIFTYHAANEDSYRNLRSLANVALLDGADASTGEFRGWFRILMENHFLFDVLMSDVAAQRTWQRYDAIIVPDLQGISDALAEKIDAFVRDGGRLIACGRVGFRDENDEPRQRPALTCLGIERVAAVRSDTRSIYLQIDDKRDWPRLAQTDLVMVDGPYVEAAYTGDTRRMLGVVLPHPFGPPERCYYTHVSDQPGLVVRPHGAGRAIHLPWLPGALYHRQGYSNTAGFMADVLEHIAGIEPVQGELPPMVEVTHLAGDGFDLVHLVNASGHFGTSFLAPVEMRDLRIDLARPQRPTGVRGLVSRTPMQWSWDTGRLTIAVPRLGLMEALRIE